MISGYFIDLTFYSLDYFIRSNLLRNCYGGGFPVAPESGVVRGWGYVRLGEEDLLLVHAGGA